MPSRVHITLVGRFSTSPASHPPAKLNGRGSNRGSLLADPLESRAWSWLPINRFQGLAQGIRKTPAVLQNHDLRFSVTRT